MLQKYLRQHLHAKFKNYEKRTVFLLLQDIKD